MAKVSIIVSDTDEENGVNIKVEFDPPLENEDDIPTSAQAEAAFLVDVMQRRASGQTLAQMADEINEDDYGHVIEGSDEFDFEEDTDEEVVH